MILPMLTRLTVLFAVAAAITACGASEGSEVVLKQPDGTEMTHDEVVKKISGTPFGPEIQDCASFAVVGQHEKGMKYPAGQAAFVAACEEGLKKAKND